MLEKVRLRRRGRRRPARRRRRTAVRPGRLTHRGLPARHPRRVVRRRGSSGRIADCEPTPGNHRHRRGRRDRRRRTRRRAAASAAAVDRSCRRPRPQPGRDYAPGVGDDADGAAGHAHPADRGRLRRRHAPSHASPGGRASPSWPRRRPSSAPSPSGGRLQRLRARLARSNSALGQGLLGAAVPGRPGRAGLGGRRGHAAGRRPRRRADDRAGRVGCAPRSRSRAPPTRRPCGAAARGAAGPRRPDAWTARSPSTPASSSARPSSSSSASTAPARPRRSASWPACSWREDKDVVLGAADTFRAAAADQLRDLGCAGRRADGPLRPRRRRPRGRGVRRGQGRHRGRGRRRASSTPRAGCTTRSG